jgi:hypothetical protein
MRSRTRRLWVVLVSALIAVSFVARPAPVAAEPTPPPTLESYAGLTVGQWSARWWQWAAIFPAAISPLSDQDGSRCWLGRLGGPVFFLAGTAGGDATRTCTVPANRPLLIPALNAECSFVSGDCGKGRRYATLLDDVRTQLAGPPAASGAVTVDGVPIEPVDAVSPAPPFPIVWAPDNPFQIPAAVGPAVAAGLWVLLQPLSPGTHTIEISGSVGDFSVNATYTLHVHGR